MITDAKTSPRAVGIDEAARLAGIGRTLLYQEISEGRLRIRKAGRRTLIPIQELDAWLNSLPQSATPRSGDLISFVAMKSIQQSSNSGQS
jgi:excisionase family DNA binding protein